MKRGHYKKSLYNEKLLWIELLGTRYVDLEDVSKKMEVSVRQLLRYIENWNRPDSLVKVKRKAGKGRFYMIEDPSSMYSSPFTQQEFDQIMDLLKCQTILDDTLKDKLIKHVYFNLENSYGFQEEINIIRKCIRLKIKLHVAKYTSREKVSKNIVLTPVHLDIARRQVVIYNAYYKKFILYNLENMKGLAATDEQADAYPPYVKRPEEHDIFGFTGKPIDIDIEMTAFARSQLIRQFPLIDKYLVRTKQDLFEYNLKIIVHDIQPIARFVMGLFDQVRLGENKATNEAFKWYYEERVLKGFELNFKE